MKFSITFLILLMSALRGLAQQDPLNALYMNTPVIINSAFTGYSHDLNVVLNYRKQWAGFDGSPSTVNFISHISLRENKMGAGLMLSQDRIGSNQTVEVQGLYGYHLSIGKETNLSFGLQAGFINFKSDYSQLIIDPNDPKFNNVSEWQPNFGAGLLLSSTKYFLSLSLPKMLQPNSDAVSLGLYNRSLNLMGSYVFVLNTRVRLRPYALYRYSARTKPVYDLGISLLGDDSYAVGVFTRSFSAYGLTALLKIGERMRLGYAFELPTDTSIGTSFTTHELQLNFRIRAFTYHDIETVRNF